MILNGKVVQIGCSTCISGLMIEVWDKDDLFSDHAAGRTYTKADGGFQLEIKSKNDTAPCTEARPRLYFKVYRDFNLLHSFAEAIQWKIGTANGQVVIQLLAAKNPVSGDSPTSKPLYLINPEQIAFMKAVAKKVAETAEEASHFNAIWVKIDGVIAATDLLLNSSQEAIQGSRWAGGVFLQTLNSLAKEFDITFPASTPTMAISDIPKDFRIPNDFIGQPDPCLFNGRDFSRIFWGIRVLPSVPDLGQPLPFDSHQLINHFDTIAFELLNRLESLQLVHKFANNFQQGVADSHKLFRQAFLTSTLSGAAKWKSIGIKSENSLSPPGITNPNSINDVPFLSFARVPFDEIPFLRFDICRAGIWFETALADRCFQKLRAKPPYEISDIFNVTKGISRKGCAGDTIEIRGRNLGRLGNIKFGTRANVVPAEWRDDLISFPLPESALTNELSLCINPEISECAFPYACVLPAHTNDLSFVVVRPITEIIFQLVGLTPEPDNPGTYHVEACRTIDLSISIPNAEEAEVVDNFGNRLWELGAELTDRVRLPDTSQSLTLRLTANNLCSGVVTQEIHILVRKLIHLATERSVEIGRALSVIFTISCPAHEGGKQFEITTTSPSVIDLLGPVIMVPAGSRMGSFEVRGVAVGKTRLRISDPTGEYETMETDFLVSPAVTSTRLSQWVNETIEIEGRGFVLGHTKVVFQGSSMRVDATAESTSTRLIVTVPEWATRGNLIVGVLVEGSWISAQPGPFLTIKDPVIESIEPESAQHGATVVFLAVDSA